MKYDIRIEGFIGDVFDFFGDTKKFTVSDLNTQLANMPSGATSIDVHINSGGGFISEGFAIHDLLSIQGIPVNTIVEGTCGSIATIIAQAPKSQNKGGVRSMLQNSEYFIHNPMFMPTGMDAYNVDDLKAITDDLKANEDKIVDFYAGVTGKSKTSLRNAMDEEKMLSSADAKSMGFIDEVVKTNINAYTRYQLVALLDKQKTNSMEDKKIEGMFAAFEARISKMLNSVGAVKPNSKTLKDGSAVYFEGEFKAGTKLFSDEKLTVQATVTETEIDGKVVKCEAGAVKEIAEPQAAAPDVTALQAELDAVKAENTALKTAKETAETKVTETETALTEVKAEVEKVNTEFVNLKNAMVTGGMATFTTNGNSKELQVAASGLDADALKVKQAMANQQ